MLNATNLGRSSLWYMYNVSLHLLCSYKFTPLINFLQNNNNKKAHLQLTIMQQTCDNINLTHSNIAKLMDYQTILPTKQINTKRHVIHNK